MNFSHPSDSVQAYWIDVISLNDVLKTWFKLLTGFSVVVGMAVPEMSKWNMSFLFLSTLILDLVGLKLI